MRFPQLNNKATAIVVNKDNKVIQIKVSKDEKTIIKGSRDKDSVIPLNRVETGMGVVRQTKVVPTEVRKDKSMM